jgi:hypothetical protein
MSKRSSFTDRYSHRRIIKTLAGALAIGAACFALAASGTPGNVIAQGLGDNDPAIDSMNKAFDAYLKSVKDMQKSFLSAEAFRLDDAHAVGAYDLIVAFMQAGARNNMSSSGTSRRGYPRFAGFDDPDTRIGVDNPDTQYMGTIVNNENCDQIFRIFGERTNTADFILTNFDTSQGSGGGPTLEDEDMIFHGPNNSFEVYAACPGHEDPSWENWLPLVAAQKLQIARRQSHCDWENEAPGPIHIERLGTVGVPSAPLDPATMTAQINDARTLNEVQAPFWPAFIDQVKQLPANTASPWLPTGGLGITTQASMLMWFDLEDDEALVIRLTDEDPRLADKAAGYYGLQLSNFWGSSADWANRQVSSNWGLDGTCQSEQAVGPAPHPAQQLISAKGGPNCGVQKPYYVVVSKQDPGVQNWIDTAELSEGMIAGRLQSVDSAEFPFVVGLGSCLLPVAFPPMPVSQVAGFLQSIGGASGFTPADRTEQLEVRQNFARDKYIFW